MMRKYGIVAVFMAVCAWMLPDGLYAMKAEAAPVMVPVCGETVTGSSEQQAIDNARYKAVKKALMRIVAIGDVSDDMSQQILRRYNDYIAGQMQVIQNKQDGKSLYVIGQVPVDMDKLRQAVHSHVREASRTEESNQVFFFVRVTGIEDAEQLSLAQRRVLDTYNREFQNLGFDVGDEDEEIVALNRYNCQSYHEFVNGVQNELCNNVEVLLAVVGECQIIPKSEDGVGATDESVVHIQVKDLVHNKNVASFDDVYVLRRAHRGGQDGTDAFLVDKSALNSAKILAGQTLRYWQQNHF